MEFIHRFKERIQQPLPGKKAQYEMARNFRSPNIEVKPDARHAGVLMLLYPLHEEWHVTLIRRTSHDKDPHSGQISFPGGKHEKTDISLEQTALREAQEEIGVAIEAIEVLGALTQLYIPVSNFEVHPFVAYTASRPDFIPEIKEVDTILEIPLSFLLNTENIHLTDLTIRGRSIQNIHCFKFEENIIWGATAMMLYELVEVVRSM